MLTIYGAVADTKKGLLVAIAAAAAAPAAAAVVVASVLQQLLIGSVSVSSIFSSSLFQQPQGPALPRAADRAGDRRRVCCICFKRIILFIYYSI